MDLPEIIAIIIIVVVILLVSLYIYKEKKKGNKCIGCPYAKNCSKNKCKNDE